MQRGFNALESLPTQGKNRDGSVGGTSGTGHVGCRASAPSTPVPQEQPKCKPWKARTGSMKEADEMGLSISHLWQVCDLQ